MKSPDRVLNEIALDCIVIEDSSYGGASAIKMTRAQFEFVCRRLWNQIELGPTERYGLGKRPTKRQAKYVQFLTTGSTKLFNIRELIACESSDELEEFIRRKIGKARGGI